MAVSANVRHVPGFIALLLLATVAGLTAQQTPSSILTPVPRVVWFSGAFHPADGGAVRPQETVTAAVYRDQQGGDALWSETQTVAIGADGRYSLLLGSMSSDGLPLDLFTAGEPRWIGVTFQRAAEIEQPRVTLASVPYAIKAADADTLGGKPASAYRLADTAAGGSGELTAGDGSKPAAQTTLPITAGTPGYLGVFTDGSSLGNSAMYQSGSYIGQGTTTPMDAFHVRFTDAVGGITGYAVQNLSAAGYSGMLFYDQAGALGLFQGFNNTSHEYRINNIASGATINFLIGASSKFKIANSGNVGIGVALPGSTLDVGGDINMTGVLRLQGTTVLHPSGGINSLGVGKGSFGNNTSTGADNTGVGASALLSNINGFNNAALGYLALVNNVSGYENTAIGRRTLSANVNGFANTAIGADALKSSTFASNTAIGAFALESSTGTANIAVGESAGSNITTGSFNIDIGNSGNALDGTGIGINGVIRIGSGSQTRFFAGGVRSIGTGLSDAIPVLIDSAGQLGTVSSSRRFKEDIQDMGEVSRRLLQLRPVTFRYKKAFDDGSKPIQYGLIAEEVAEVFPDLVAHSADGQIETVKYQLLDVLLLNEVQKQKAEIDDLRQRLAKLEAALTARQ